MTIPSETEFKFKFSFITIPKKTKDKNPRTVDQIIIIYFIKNWNFVSNIYKKVYKQWCK